MADMGIPCHGRYRPLADIFLFWLIEPHQTLNWGRDRRERTDEADQLHFYQCHWFRVVNVVFGDDEYSVAEYDGIRDSGMEVQAVGDEGLSRYR